MPAADGHTMGAMLAGLLQSWTLRCAVLAVLVPAAPAWAGEYAVTNGNDSGSGSLRAALDAANASDDVDRIFFTAAHRVTSSGTLTVANPVSIDGGAGTLAGGDLLIAHPFVAVSRLGVAPPNRISASSPAPPSVLRVFRGSDGAVRISGTAPAPGVLELFAGGGERFINRYTAGTPAGSFTEPVGSEPTAGDLLTMTITTAEGTSGFASPVGVPSDLVAPRVTAARTADLNADGRADALRVETSKPLDDSSGYSGLVLDGAPIAAARSGSGRDDDAFEAVLAGQQPGDVRPFVRVAANSSLADARGNQVLVMSQGVRAADDVAPEVRSSVAVSRTAVRVRFSEPVTGTVLKAEDFTLSMGGEARTITRVDLAADGVTADLTANRAWPSGTAGILRVKGVLTDKVGNVSRSTHPTLRVWGSPGDVTPPKLTRVRLSKRVVCIKAVSANCTTSGGLVTFVADEPVTVVLVLRRAGSGATNTLKAARSEGPGSVRFKEKIEGRRLRPGAYRLTVSAVDAAGNESTERVLALRVRR